jgi:histidine triad (HIT) family protein
VYDPNNVFAKILRGDLPCYKVYEDADTIAFMDLMPQSDGHLLVVPREAAVEIFDLSDAAAEAAIRTTKKLAIAVRKAFSPDGIRLAQFNGPASGQTVPHVHFHIVPCYEGQAMRGHARDRQDAEVLRQHAERVIAALRELDA